MRVDLKKVTFETPIWYKGIECRITTLYRSTDSNTGKHQWTVCLVDKEYCNAWFNEGGFCVPNYERVVHKVYTGNIHWEYLEKDCHISNAIDFIREKE